MNHEQAIRVLEARLDLETDCADVHAALDGGDPGFVLVDSRSDAAWKQGHIPGAVHRPEDLPAGTPVVTYCWGPGCNRATKAALAYARRGHPVKEMIGGIEYWVREGFPVANDLGITTTPVDRLCGCV